MKINRRSFLRATVASAGAVVFGAGCGDSTDEPTSDAGTDLGSDTGGGDTGGSPDSSGGSQVLAWTDTSSQIAEEFDRRRGVAREVVVEVAEDVGAAVP